MKHVEIKVIPFEAKYAEQTVIMWRDSKYGAIGQRELHSFESHVNFLNHILSKDFTVELATVGEKVVGMIAYNRSQIDQLYIHNGYQNAGIGRKLLERAKVQSNGALTLFTFEVNEKAQRFYEKHGFVIIGRGSDNEENLPDIQYEWKEID
ncbi:GNAT family N-acetyltransferase [Sutcliffiella horikoshii]|uniref:GNAT family N-acetyltransferase n=1 Tax=Sutcliffiella horikoshii TaxID=79883 RepID=UPI00203D4DA2|nr:GNAT family N-acetyltransferase [Sutcliffiella horikoshii]MCM3618594.1 GNAT family N-acetyltransferase [Sutcliffiella horikoshii]